MVTSQLPVLVTVAVSGVRLVPSAFLLHSVGSGHACLGREGEGGVAGLSRIPLGTQEVRQQPDELPKCLFLLKGKEVGERGQKDRAELTDMAVEVD